MHEFFNYFGASSVLRLQVRCTLKIHLGVLEREGKECTGGDVLENARIYWNTSLNG